MKTVLITGGAGFIGSHLANRMVKDHRVIVVDNLERGSTDFLRFHDNLHFVEADLRQYRKIKHLFKGVDMVIHLASKVGGIGVYLLHPYDIISSNIKIDANVLRAVIEYKIPKYFYASSAHVYPIDLQLSNNPPMLKERDANGGCWLSYGWAKLTGEKCIEFALQEHDFLSAAVARFVGIYGPHQDYNLSTGSVIPVFSHRAIKHPSMPFTVWGDGTETRTYCYIDDALDCVGLMLNKLEKVRCLGPVNVGSDKLISISEIAESVVDISGKDAEIEYDKKEKAAILGQRCDVNMARNLLGWEATTALRDGLTMVYNDVKKRVYNEKISPIVCGID